MKKFLMGLFIMLSMIVQFTQDAQAYGEPKFVYDKFKEYIKKEKALQSDTYKTSYFFAPFSGAERTPVMFMISFDSANRKVTATHLGLSYKNNNQLVWFASPIDLGYSDVEIFTVGNDVYFLTDLGDGRGRIGLRIPDAFNEPIDRGTITPYQKIFKEYGRHPEISSVDSYSLLNDAFSDWM